MSENQGGVGGYIPPPTDPGVLLDDPKVMRKDLKMLKSAIAHGWAVPEEMKAAALKRILHVLEKPTITAMSEIGPVNLDGPADATAMRAVGVLVQMTGQAQEDYWKADTNSRLDAGKLTGNIAFQPGAVNQLPLPQSLDDAK